MASSRHMRRSRRASPTNGLTSANIPIKVEPPADYQDIDPSEGWVEPPLRAPVPSFEDYKGLERHGVLEHMAPLGSLPNSKVRARLKQHEAPRRAAHMRNGEARGAKNEVDQGGMLAPPAAQHSEPRNTEDRTKKSSSLSHDECGSHDHTHTPREAPGIAPVKVTVVPSSAPNGTPRSRTAHAQQKLDQIVDAAVDRANELGDPVLGNAVKELYEESLRNASVATLLDAVLSQSSTPEQSAEFQSRIRAARKRHKEAIATQDRAQKAVSSSPIAKSSRSSVTRHSDNTRKLPTPPPPKSLAQTHNHHLSNHFTEIKESNGSSRKDERPSKRMKRSRSTSSDSSLSSLDSTIEDFPPSLDPPQTVTTNHSVKPQINQAKPRPSNGPRLGTFPVRPTDLAARRPITLHVNAPNAHPRSEDVVARRREQMRQRCIDVIGTQTVQDSAVRASPSPIYSPHSPSPVTALTARYQQQRSNILPSQRRVQDEYDTLDSPVSSSFGDLLLPPPPGVSRGATPNHLGRQPKVHKKAARIKMSPLKKRTTTTAGRGADVEGGNTMNVRTDNARTDNGINDGNSDVCTACSGDGSLLCCEGCIRAFHLTCCEPPLDTPPKGEWLCNKCTEARTDMNPPTGGIFSLLLGGAIGKNPVSYALPEPLRNYFEGVKTGEEGEYEETNIIKSNKTRGGYEEAPNNFRLKDNKDNTILCYRCSQSSMGHREIIPCDYCNLSWHLDCLDPPLAIAPKKRHNGQKPRTNAWMCPNHMDSELHKFRTQESHVRNQSGSRRKYKIRHPKVYTIVDFALRRGLKNNGLIEIENDPSDDDKFTKNMSGQIYRVHEKGIKLDFIDRIKRINEEEAHSAQLHQMSKKTCGMNESMIGDESSFDDRPFQERKAALNLVQMAQSQDSALSPDRVRNLIETLVAEAPDNVGELIENGNGDRAFSEEEVSEEERRDLQALIELALRRLAGPGEKP